MHPPSVDKLARSLAGTGLPHPLLVDVARAAIADGDHENAEARATSLARSLLQPVVNATGTLLHTNLGRAPWSHHGEASFLNLEFDLETGQRGSRQRAVAQLYARLCEAEAALIVNNCAAAVTLAMAEAFGVPVLINSNLRDGSLRQCADEHGINMLLSARVFARLLSPRN